VNTFAGRAQTIMSASRPRVVFLQLFVKIELTES